MFGVGSHAKVVRDSEHVGETVILLEPAGRAKRTKSARWLASLPCGTSKVFNEKSLAPVTDDVNEPPGSGAGRTVSCDVAERAAASERHHAAYIEEASEPQRAEAAEDAAILASDNLLEPDSSAAEVSNAPTRPASTPPGSHAPTPIESSAVNLETVQDSMVTVFGMRKEQLAALMQPSGTGLHDLARETSRRAARHEHQLQAQFACAVEMDELNCSAAFTPRQAEHLWQRVKTTHATLAAQLPPARAALAALERGGMHCKAQPTSVRPALQPMASSVRFDSFGQSRIRVYLVRGRIGRSLGCRTLRARVSAV